ncbi:hypothetical protein VTJ49DRAFT_3153 [Mycothermus thermophilus]|uniref:F-box domain-containing protein n=1 Tax=Humicola insolens TaxID=85995 RepID=A0ABR3V8M1_HUMIN
MSLMKLPDELLTEIAKYFTRGLPDPPISRYYDPLPDDLFSGPGQDLHAYNPRQCLVSLAVTNRRLNAIATGLLYQTIRIRDLSTLYAVTLTLLEAPHLASHVREVFLAADLTLPANCHDELEKNAMENLIRLLGIDDDIYNTFDSAVDPFPDLGKVFIDAVHKHIGDLCFGPFEDDNHYEDSDLEGIAEATCALLLLFTPNVVNLQLALPNPRLHKYPLLTSVLASQAQPIALPRLERLRLISNLPSVDFPEPPQNLPQDAMVTRAIKHVEVSGASFLDANVLVKDAWAHIETLYMESSFFSGAWLYALCKDGGAPRLKHIDIEAPNWYYIEDAKIKNMDGPGINEALSFCTSRLQKLRLQFIDTPTVEPHLGPQGKLTCLSSMEVLSDLEIEARYLFDSLEDMQSANICDRLSPSLRRLTLYEQHYMKTDPWWEGEPDGGWGSPIGPDNLSYEDLLKRALSQLAFESADRLPRLESVTITRRVFAYLEPWEVNPELYKRVHETSCYRGRYEYLQWTFTPQR